MKKPTLILCVAVTALAGCGGSGGDGSDTASATDKNREALLKFARCMREQGVPMPDPVSSEDGGMIVQQPTRDVKPPSEAKMREAEQKCAKFRASVTPPKISEEEEAKMREAALKHARCMREHGVDFPDPKFDGEGGGGIRVEIDKDDPNDPDFQRAEEACREIMGGFMRGPGGAR